MVRLLRGHIRHIVIGWHEVASALRSSIVSFWGLVPTSKFPRVPPFSVCGSGNKAEYVDLAHLRFPHYN